MKLKRSKENFRSSVQSAMSRERITKEVVRKFARRARGYTCAYYAFEYRNKNGEAQGEKISPQLIEQMVKRFKMHHSALDFEGNIVEVGKTTSD